MFDENGIWKDTVYPVAGPSGGATGALDLMNVMQSGQNYNQQHSAAMLAFLAKMLADKNAGALVGTPDAATATGMTPEQVQSAYAATPSQRAIQMYGQLTPDQQTDPEEMMRVGIMSGAEPLNAGLASSVKLQDQYRKADTATNNNYTKILDMARKIQTGPHARTNPQEATQQAIAYINAAGPTLGLSPDAVQAAVTELTSSTEGFGVDPKVQAQINAMKAMTDYRQMQTSLLPAESAAKIARLDAATGLAGVETTLKQIDAAYASKGEISPQMKAKMMMQLNVAMAQMSARGPGIADALAAGDPNTQALFRERVNLGLKTLKAYADKLDTGSASAPAHGGVAPTVVATGVEKGTNRKVEKLSDGTVRYADSQ